MSKLFRRFWVWTWVLLALLAAAVMLSALASLAQPRTQVEARPYAPEPSVEGFDVPVGPQASAVTGRWWQVQARWRVSALEGASVTFEASPLEAQECVGPQLSVRSRRAVRTHHSAEGQQGEASFCLLSSGEVSRMPAPQGVWRSLRDDEEVSVEWDAGALRVPTAQAVYVLRLAALTGCADDESSCTGAVVMELVPEGSDARLAAPSGGFTSGRFDVLTLSAY